jgi:tRNA_anti-like
LTARKKNIAFFFIAIIIIAAATGFYFYNKGPVNVSNADAIKINAVALYQIFLTDSAEAKREYANKILLVSGLVKKVSKNQQNQAVVMLQTNEAGAFINCTMEDGKAVLVENKTISLKGICSGMGVGDADLGISGDVYLVRCYQTK